MTNVTRHDSALYALHQVRQVLGVAYEARAVAQLEWCVVMVTKFVENLEQPEK